MASSTLRSRFSGVCKGRSRAAVLFGAVCTIAFPSLTCPALAFRIELKDVAPDRIERQRAAAIGHEPLPGTPNIAQFEQRLKEHGMSAGAGMFVRVFKAESELEVWLQKGDRFELFATYPICHWSGTLGPKVSEGDKQSPEGVYTVTQRQLHMIGRHPRSLNLGFPNVFDRQFQRTGSYILIHGGCGSVGCFAMTNPVIEEVFTLAQAALRGGQDALHVHVFPFRLTEARLQAYATHEWYDFWRNLKDVYDTFEKTRRPPKVSVCEGRYWVDPSGPGSNTTGNGEVASQGPLAVCGAPQEVASSNFPTESVSLTVGTNPFPRPLDQLRQSQNRLDLKPQPGRAQPSPRDEMTNPRMVLQGKVLIPIVPRQCVIDRPSCRKWFVLQNAKLDARLVALSRVASSQRQTAQRRP